MSRSDNFAGQTAKPDQPWRTKLLSASAHDHHYALTVLVQASSTSSGELVLIQLRCMIKSAQPGDSL